MKQKRRTKPFTPSLPDDRPELRQRLVDALEELRKLKLCLREVNAQNERYRLAVAAFNKSLKST